MNAKDIKTAFNVMVKILDATRKETISSLCVEIALTKMKDTSGDDTYGKEFSQLCDLVKGYCLTVDQTYERDVYCKFGDEKFYQFQTSGYCLNVEKTEKLFGNIVENQPVVMSRKELYHEPTRTI